MTTLLSWVPLALYFMVSLAATSVIGLACYKVVRWMEAKLPETLAGAKLILICLIICVIASSLALGLVVVGILSVICGLGTCAERAILPVRQSWGSIFMRLVFTTACCMALSCIPMVMAFYSLSTSAGVAPLTWIAGGSIMGALCSPSIVPAFTWLWRSMEMRPGVDRHIEAEERLKPQV